MSINLVPFNSDGGFITAGNITTASYASPAPTISGFSSVNSDNISLGVGQINGGTATVVDDGINSIALALGAQMDVYGFPFSATTRGQLTISGVTTPSEANGTWYYQSVNTNTYQLYTDSTYTSLVDATGWSAYTGGGTVAIVKQVPAANIVINSNGFLTNFDNTGTVTAPGNISANYFIGNGSQLTGISGGGGGNSISDGTSNVSVVATNGNVIIGVDNDVASWTFATDGNVYAKPETDLILVVADPNGDGYAVKQSLTDGTTELSRTSLEDGQFSIYTNLDSTIDEWRFDGNTLQVSNNSTVRGFDSNVTIQSMFAGGNGTASLQSVSNQNDPNVFSTFDATTTSASIKVYNGGSNGGTGYIWTFDNGGNLTLPGNTFTVNYANGTAVSLGGGSGTVTSVQGDGIVSGLSLTGNVTTTGNLTLSGTLDLSSLSGNISTTGNITAANLGNISSINLDGNVSNVLAGNGTWIAAGSGGGIGNLSAFGNVIYSNVTGTPAGFVNFDTGNGSMLLGTNSSDQVQIVVDEIGTPKSWTFATDGSLAAPGAVSATGNVTGGNVNTGGVVSATGNVTGNYFIGNGSQLTSLPSPTPTEDTGNTDTFVMVTDGALKYTGHVTIKPLSGDITTLGNIATGTLSATGNVTAGNISTSGSGGNITGANVITATTFSATGTASNLVRRANVIGAANAVVTLDNITAQLGGSPIRLYIGAANSNMTMAGTSQTISTGSLAAANWINVPIVTGAGNAFAMSGAVSSNGDTVILNVTDQGAGSGTWRVTGLIANTSSNLYSVSIERLA